MAHRQNTPPKFHQNSLHLKHQISSICSSIVVEINGMPDSNSLWVNRLMSQQYRPGYHGQKPYLIEYQQIRPRRQNVYLKVLKLGGTWQILCNKKVSGPCELTEIIISVTSFVTTNVLCRFCSIKKVSGPCVITVP